MHESSIASLTHGVVVVLVLTLLVSLNSTSTLAQHQSTEGLVLAVGVQQGTLLIETRAGYVLAAVDPYAAIDSPLNGTRSLGDLHVGDLVEYRAESFAGMLIVRELHVVPHLLR
jgi:hypothetical protein